MRHAVLTGPRRRTPPGTATRARAAGRSARPRAAHPSARRSARTSAAARDATTGADGGRARRRRGGGRAREAEARFVRRRRSPSRDPDGATPGPRGVVGRSSSFGSGATAARRRRRDASASGSGSYITLYYITLHYIKVYGTVQYSTVQYGTVQYITLHSTPLHYSTVHYRAHRVGERVARRARERRAGEEREEQHGLRRRARYASWFSLMCHAIYKSARSSTGRGVAPVTLRGLALWATSFMRARGAAQAAALRPVTLGCDAAAALCATALPGGLRAPPRPLLSRWANKERGVRLRHRFIRPHCRSTPEGGADPPCPAPMGVRGAARSA